MLSIMRTTSRPPPSRPREIAVVRIIATVIVMLRRSPVRTSLNTKLARIGVGVPSSGAGRSRAGDLGYSAADAVHTTCVVPDHLAEAQLDHAAAHRVHD